MKNGLGSRCKLYCNAFCVRVVGFWSLYFVNPHRQQECMLFRSNNSYIQRFLVISFMSFVVSVDSELLFA